MFNSLEGDGMLARLLPHLLADALGQRLNLSGRTARTQHKPFAYRIGNHLKIGHDNLSPFLVLQSRDDGLHQRIRSFLHPMSLIAISLEEVAYIGKRSQRYG